MIPELYISCDVEADGPLPGPYSMISFGMSVVGHPELRFYTEIRPISEQFVPEALAISGLDRDRLIREAPSAEQAMKAASDWVNGLRTQGEPVFLAAPAVWDGMFIQWYFIRFTGANPFGVTGAGIDLRSYWMGLKGCRWDETIKKNIKREVGLKKLQHSHHAAEDAEELAKIFGAVLKHRPSS